MWFTTILDNKWRIHKSFIDLTHYCTYICLCENSQTIIHSVCNIHAFLSYQWRFIWISCNAYKLFIFLFFSISQIQNPNIVVLPIMYVLEHNDQLMNYTCVSLSSKWDVKFKERKCCKTSYRSADYYMFLSVWLQCISFT